MTSPAFFDSHCHLDPDVYGSDEGVDEVIERARQAGVRRMLCIGAGYGFDTAHRALGAAERHPDVWASVGLHPHDAQHWTQERHDRMIALARHPKVVALGEMGLDFHYDNSPRDVQRDVLRRQLAAALELELPIIVHDRDCGDECLRIVEDEGGFGGRGVVWHCFSGDAAMMREIVSRGGYVSLPGIVTFKKAAAMQEVAREVPLSQLFIETDSPFLTPAPFRGKRNEPARVVLVAEKIAELRGEPVDAIARATWDNASRFFGIA